MNIIIVLNSNKLVKNVKIFVILIDKILEKLIIKKTHTPNSFFSIFENFIIDNHSFFLFS